ncbi:MAG: cytochrome c oxidase assembly protein [Chloroflexi bacterium]|nr:cytochrome c oxidase assembly protein [Chloroflexota bacterium]
MSGARRSRIHGRRWPLWRTGVFLLGCAAIVGALLSPIDALAHDLFSVHMVQHMLLVAVAAPLILLGAPIRPVLRGMPRSWRRWIVRPIARNAAVRAALHLLRHPLVAGALYVAGLYAWHVPLLYDAALADELVHVLEHLWFMVTALLFWSCVIDPEPFRSRLPYPARIFYLLLAGAGQNTILGGLLAFSTRLLYRSYEGRPERYGLDAVLDQRIGGAIMWVPGDLIFLAAASASFFLWLAEEERVQIRREKREK